LTALGEAMLWLRDHFAECFPNKLSNQGITVHIRFDSEYAAKSILGIYNGPKNKMLISNIRKLYNDVRNQEKVETIPCYDSSHEGNITALKFNLHFSHVKGHSKNKWNDAVDLLATKGKSGHVGVGGRYQNLSNAPVTSSSFVSNTEIIQSKNSESDLKVDETSTTIVLDSDIETDPKAKTKTKPKRSSKSESQSLKDKPSEVMVIDSENETAPTKDAEVILKPHRRSLTNRIRSRSNSSSPQN
jgi:ribonuclease HI